MVRKLMARKSGEFADTRGLSAADHAALARLAQTSRPRVTAILNGNLEGVSTNLLLRLLGVLGVRGELKFRRAA